MKAVNIKWDTDGDKELLSSLPTEVELPYELTGDSEEDIDYDGIDDYLSDEVGFCHFGYELE